MADCYSRDEENYFDDWSEVLAMLDDDGYLEAGAVIYEGEKVQRPASFFGPGARWLIEHMEEQAAEEAGEFAGDWPLHEFTKDKQAELEKLINDWLDANVPVHFWTVKNVRKVELTEADIADYRGETPAGVKGLEHG
jgi:hypothetical protein